MSFHTKDKTTNEYGVTVSSTEDFSGWDWGSDDAISIAAAELVIEAIRKNAMHDIRWEETEKSAIITFGILEHNTNVSAPLLAMVDEWIELHTLSEVMDELDAVGALAVANQLEEAAAKLRAAVAVYTDLDQGQSPPPIESA